MSTKKDSKNEITISSKQRKQLRSLGHALEPKVLVGREAFSDNVIKTVDEALDAHELIKVKLGQNCPVDKKEAASFIADKTKALMVQLIGKTILLYRKNPDIKDKEKAIRI